MDSACLARVKARVWISRTYIRSGCTWWPSVIQTCRRQRQGIASQLDWQNQQAMGSSERLTRYGKWGAIKEGTQFQPWTSTYTRVPHAYTRAQAHTHAHTTHTHSHTRGMTLQFRLKKEGFDIYVPQDPKATGNYRMAQMKKIILSDCRGTFDTLSVGLPPWSKDSFIQTKDQASEPHVSSGKPAVGRKPGRSLGRVSSRKHTGCHSNSARMFHLTLDPRRTVQKNRIHPEISHKSSIGCICSSNITMTP